MAITRVKARNIKIMTKNAKNKLFTGSKEKLSTGLCWEFRINSEREVMPKIHVALSNVNVKRGSKLILEDNIGNVLKNSEGFVNAKSDVLIMDLMLIFFFFSIIDPR